MATHSSVLAWRIPEMGEPGGLPSMGLQSRTRLNRLSSSSTKMNLCLLLIQFLKAGAGDSVHSQGNLVKDTRCDTESSKNIILSCSHGTFSWSNY